MTEQPNPHDELVRRPTTSPAEIDHEVDDADPSDQVFTLMNSLEELIGKSAIEMQQMNTASTYRSLQLGKRYAAQAEALLPFTRYISRHLLGFLEMMHGIGRIVKPQMEADYPAALLACRETHGMFERQIEMAREFAEVEPQGFQQVAFASEIEPFYSGMIEVVQAIENAMAGEQRLYQGDIPGYLEHATKSLDRFETAHQSMALCDFPMFSTIRNIFAAQANLLRRRIGLVNTTFSLRSRYIVPSGQEVFVVHGHDYANRDLLVGMLGEWGIKPAVMIEEANAGLTVIEKFLRAAERSRYAIVLFTPDDHVTNPSTPAPYHQARPNVLFELGWFFGRYGPGCVCVLVKKGMPIPSDMGGVIFLEFEHQVNEAKCRDGLLLELVHAGIVQRPGSRPKSIG